MRVTMAVEEVVEEALQIHSTVFIRHDIEVRREFLPVPPLIAEKHKILQILINLFRNAKEACEGGESPEKVIVVRILRKDPMVGIEVQDNGTGIPPENLTRIFAHGFTTKIDGHGFGLHGAALAAGEMGGSLSVRSDGVGKGATFVLELPMTSPGESA